MTTAAQIPPVASAPLRNAPTRRALLAGALGGLGALIASAIGRPAVTDAGVDGDVVLGAANYATTVTTIANTNPAVASNMFYVSTLGAGEGVRGSSHGGIGVAGQSDTNIGINGWSGSNIGVNGYSQTSNQAGVQGSSNGGSGVEGFSVSGYPPAARAKTGVYGYANWDNFSRGVIGESPAGIGVLGVSTSGYAGYFSGRVYTTRYFELSETAIPGAPNANRARLFLKDNGLGKTQLCVLFNTGAVQVLATQP